VAGFRKAKAEQAALKVGLYGPAGSGKTFTALLMSEGLAKAAGGRIAYVDTERGTDFYCQAVPQRQIHPEAFDFDAIYTRSITEVVKEVKALNPKEHSVVVLDSMTHLWQACIASYGGKQTSVGTIPMHAWGKIKKPYHELMSFLLSSTMHVFICGRQGTEYETDEETEELKAVGVKMKAEGETAYEPHILIRMESIRAKKTSEVSQIIAYIEKDRTGVLAGRSFLNPSFATLCKPLMGLLGSTQAKMDTVDEAASKDAESIAQDDQRRAEESKKLLEQWRARLTLADDAKALKAIGKSITPELKSRMTTHDVASLREAYLARETELLRTSAEPEVDVANIPPDVDRRILPNTNGKHKEERKSSLLECAKVLADCEVLDEDPNGILKFKLPDNSVVWLGDGAKGDGRVDSMDDDAVEQVTNILERATKRSPREAIAS